MLSSCQIMSVCLLFGAEHISCGQNIILTYILLYIITVYVRECIILLWFKYENVVSLKDKYIQYMVFYLNIHT